MPGLGPGIFLAPARSSNSVKGLPTLLLSAGF
jgi:hypothetical protein